VMHYELRADMDRQKAIKYLEGLFLGLLEDLERSSRILNDREIEKGSGSGKGKGGKTVLVERKRKLDDEDGNTSTDDDGDRNEDGSTDEQISRAKIGQVGIELRLKNRTTGSACQPPLTPKLMSSEDQVITYPDEPFAKKESALHKLSKSAALLFVSSRS
jgi:hypothetical protein